MANAARDNNFVPTLLATLNTDGLTLVAVQVDPVLHGLQNVDAATGSDHGPTDAKRDENFVSGLMAVSSADGVTPVSVYCDSSGNLLIKST